MNSKNTENLLKKYPKIFRQHTLPPTETCMCWLFECGDGWYDMIDKLCDFLQFHIDRNKHPQIEATQVKEKFGTLRFYNTGGDDYLRGIIEYVEWISGTVCEECGSTEKVTQTKGWIVTLCEKCMKKREERYQHELEEARRTIRKNKEC